MVVKIKLIDNNLEFLTANRTQIPKQGSINNKDLGNKIESKVTHKKLWTFFKIGTARVKLV